MNGYSVERPSRGVIQVRMDDVKSGWEQWIMFSSDRHFDSAHCDRALMKQQLDKALERKAMIIDVGDFYDCMQGKFDPRRSYSGLRPEYKVDTYLDEIVSDAARFMKPYAGNILMIGRGNHDNGIIKNNGTDLISNLVYRLNADNGTNVQVGGYGGWIRFLFKISGHGQGMNIKYFHGSGGGGVVTRGVIQTNRQAVYLPDADVVVNGHIHDSYIVPISRERLSIKGNPYQDIIWFVRTPTYQDDYGDGTTGWHVERGAPPKPKGCAWMRLWCEDGKTVKSECTLDLV